MLSHLRILGGGYWWEDDGELYSQLSLNYFINSIMKSFLLLKNIYKLTADLKMSEKQRLFLIYVPVSTGTCILL